MPWFRKKIHKLDKATGALFTIHKKLTNNKPGQKLFDKSKIQKLNGQFKSSFEESRNLMNSELKAIKQLIDAFMALNKDDKQMLASLNEFNENIGSNKLDKDKIRDLRSELINYLDRYIQLRDEIIAKTKELEKEF